MSLPGSSSRQPVTVELTSVRRTRTGLVTGVVSLLAGAAALITALSGTYADDATARVGALVLGTTLVALGALILIGMGIAGPVRRMVFDEDGFALEGIRRPWRVGWAEVARIGVHVARRGLIVPSYRVRMEWEPVSDEFAAAHPQLARLRVRSRQVGRRRYAFGVGPRRDLVEPLDVGLDVYAGQRYAGVAEEGRRPPPDPASGPPAGR